MTRKTLGLNPTRWTVLAVAVLFAVYYHLLAGRPVGTPGGIVVFGILAGWFALARK